MAVNITDIELHRDFISGHVKYYMSLNAYKYYVCGYRGTSQDVTCWFSTTDFIYKSTSSDNTSYTFSNVSNSTIRGYYYLYDESTDKYSTGSTTQSVYLKKSDSVLYTNSNAFKDYITYDHKDFFASDCPVCEKCPECEKCEVCEECKECETCEVCTLCEGDINMRDTNIFLLGILIVVLVLFLYFVIRDIFKYKGKDFKYKDIND